ncbi:MAG: DUF2007 domain-containing protein [Actinomycetota bacterium]|nr:DUF2007 domain-containing protein [Actinomycetota bacterium]
MTTRTDRGSRVDQGAGGIDPGVPDLDFGGGGAGWVELLRAHDDIEAHLLIGRLLEGGIETRTLKDRSAPGAWLYGGSNPWAPVVILVKKVQLEDARLVLAEISWAQPSIDPQVATSPREVARSHAIAWWAAALALGLAFTSIALARTADVLHGCELPLVCGGSQEGPP